MSIIHYLIWSCMMEITLFWTLWSFMSLDVSFDSKESITWAGFSPVGLPPFTRRGPLPSVFSDIRSVSMRCTASGLGNCGSFVSFWFHLLLWWLSNTFSMPSSDTSCLWKWWNSPLQSAFSWFPWRPIQTFISIIGMRAGWLECMPTLILGGRVLQWPGKLTVCQRCWRHFPAVPLTRSCMVIFQVLGSLHWRCRCVRTRPHPHVRLFLFPQHRRILSLHEVLLSTYRRQLDWNACVPANGNTRLAELFRVHSIGENEYESELLTTFIASGIHYKQCRAGFPSLCSVRLHYKDLHIL